VERFFLFSPALTFKGVARLKAVTQYSFLFGKGLAGRWRRLVKQVLGEARQFYRSAGFPGRWLCEGKASTFCERGAIRPSHFAVALCKFYCTDSMCANHFFGSLFALFIAPGGMFSAYQC